MEAKLVQMGEVLVVNINGRLDIDKAHPFREACFKNLLDKKVVFNLQQLNFVGSTGIKSFFQLLKEVHTKNKFGVRIVGMAPDFLRVWVVEQEKETPGAVGLFDSTHMALQSFIEAPQLPEAQTEGAETDPSVLRIS